MFVATIVMIFQASPLAFFIRDTIWEGRSDLKFVWNSDSFDVFIVAICYRSSNFLFDTFSREISPNGFGWTNRISFRNFSSFSVLFKPGKSKSIILQQFWRKEFVTFCVGRTTIDSSIEGKQEGMKFCLCSTCLRF